MGNTSSNNNTKSNNQNENQTKEFGKFDNVIDYIASNYILTMNFKSLSNLAEKEECDKLVILTSDIIKNNFNEREITYMSQRVKQGQPTNEMKTQKLTYVTKDKLDDLDASKDKFKSITKKRMCIGIAKFYVKIAHVFAAIMMTLNPVYSYTDLNGNNVKVGLLEKDKIPKGAKNRKVDKFNICDNRVRALKKDMLVDEETKQTSINPRVCDMNINKQTQQSKNLLEEPGIPELMTLYYDDDYDYGTGQFKGMSDKAKQQFSEDLKTFYVAFTGNKEMPAYITKFSDIKLQDYKSKTNCVNGILKKTTKIETNSELLKRYAENINNMINNAKLNQKKLLDVINMLFSFKTETYTNKQIVRINPHLTEKTLQEIIEKTRRIIIDLYVRCETDYVEGIKLYESIIQKKILETTQNQIDTLKNTRNNIVNSNSV
jgi:hypothetical protein